MKTLNLSAPPALVPDALPGWSTGLVAIRSLTRRDLPALEWDGEYTHFRRLYAEAYRRLQAGRSLAWVADLPQVGVIGQLFVQLSSERQELADGFYRAYLHSFRVRPAYRHAGLGTRMMQVAEAVLAQRGFHQITLNVSRDNLDAQRLYLRHGYHVEAPEPGQWMYLDDQGRLCSVNDPSWRMVKNLSTPLI